MIQLRTGVSGSSNPVVFLDLYDEDLPKLTLSIEDITTTATTTTFSRLFRVPATTNNSLFFETAFDINGFDFDITQRYSATILIDGNDYKRGEIRLQKVYNNEVGNRIDYEILFLGEIRDLLSSIGEGNLCDLDLSEYNHELTLEFLTGSWEAYPQNTYLDPWSGEFSGSIIYPLVDFGNSYDDSGVAIETRIATNSIDNNFTNSSYPLSMYRFRPAIRAKVIWDKIFEDAGYTYTSNFFDRGLIRQLYVGAWGDDAVVQNSSFGTSNNAIVRSGYGSISPTSLGYWRTMMFDEGGVVQDNGNNLDLDDDAYSVPATGDYYGQVNWRLLSSWDEAPDGGAYDGFVDLTIRTIAYDPAFPLSITTLYTDNRTLENFEQIYSTDNLTYDFDTTTAFPSGIPAGYHIKTQITATAEQYWRGSQWVGPQANQSYLWIYDSDGEVDISTMMSCDFLQTDFIKDIVSKFRLVIAPDSNNFNNFIIEPWADYIGVGDIYDWTEKIDNSKDITIQPIYYTQKKEVKFTDKVGTDYLNTLNQTNFNEVYGSLNIVDPNTLLKGTRKIETKLMPLASTQIEGSNLNPEGMFNTIIPQIHSHDISDSGTLLHLPVKAGVRLFFYDGIKSTGTTPANDGSWWLWDESSSPIELQSYPMISQFSEWGTNTLHTYGLDTQTIDLNWQRELTYIKGYLTQYNIDGTFAGPANTLPWANSVYDRFWSTYISTLYSPWSRRITAYFILDSNDLIDFNFDDVIFIKNAYYYVEKIYDVVIGKKSSVKVDLIKLNNYYPNTDGFIPIGSNWEDVEVNWEAETSNWESI